LLNTIYQRKIEYENVSIIEECLEHIENKLNYSFISFTVDGRRGIIELLKEKYKSQIPIQLCQFHQSQMVTRYITNNPKLLCSIELKELMKTLTNKKTTEEEFKNNLNNLKNKYKDFLKEKSEENPREFKHKRVKSALRSLTTNLPYLFTYKKLEHKNKNIPNTTNCCDGKFSQVKGKLRIHRGLKQPRRDKMFEKLIE
jgi:hypothetical protein